MEFLCRDGFPRRYVCANKETYLKVWPRLFSRKVPAALSCSHWAAQGGAAMHCALKLQFHLGRGCCVIASRPISSGRTLISLPLILSLTSSSSSSSSSSLSQGQQYGSFHHRWDALEEMTGILVRELHNPSSFYRIYLEFLHDIFNNENTDVETWRSSLREELDTMYMGNSILANGIQNAPFISKNSLNSVSQRVEWVRLQNILRRIEQSLPHFASKSTSWGMSMALSRTISDDNGELTLYPFIDFCLHSFEPNTRIQLTHPNCIQDIGVGVRWYDSSKPSIHLIAQRDIKAGEVLTIKYCNRRVNCTEDEDYWKLRWGYVPC